MSATVVLVHGAWHGAWCFDRVVAMLRAERVDAVAVDLPGHGSDPGPFTDLHGDAARVRAVLDEIGSDAVLLGHSYGGAVITEAGDHRAVRHLVFLCAFALERSESCMTAAADSAATIDHSGRPNLADAIEVHEDGTTTLESRAAVPCLYNDCDDETVAWAVPLLGPQPGVTLSDSPCAVAWRTRPSTYVVCTADQTVHPDLQRIMARRCGRVVEWPTGHSPFASRPELLAGLLVDLARAPGVT